MDKINEEILDKFNAYIVSIAQAEVRKILEEMNLEDFRNVKVIGVTSEGQGADTVITHATVEDMVTGETIKNVPNESGKLLEKGDIVRLYETRGNYHNQYIGLLLERSEE